MPSATTSNTLVIGFISKETGKGAITAHTQTDTDTRFPNSSTLTKVSTLHFLITISLIYLSFLRYKTPEFSLQKILRRWTICKGQLKVCSVRLNLERFTMCHVSILIICCLLFYIAFYCIYYHISLFILCNVYSVYSIDSFGFCDMANSTHKHIKFTALKPS